MEFEVPPGIALEPAESREGVASYESAETAARWEFAGVANGLKSNIVLADQSAPAVYHFKLDASQGLTPTLQSDGSIRIQGADGGSVAELPAPVMYDAAEISAPADAIRYDLQEGETGRGC